MHSSTPPHTSVLPQQTPGNTPPGSCWSSTGIYTLSLQQKEAEAKDVDMKPLDLSLRAPQRDTWSGRTTSSYLKSNTVSHPSSFSSSSSSSTSAANCRSQRLSPYPVLTPSTASPRHVRSPCLAPSRSPLARSISPYYLYHRQTASPYYNYLSGSCTPPENCSSLQVLSSTNRLLNGMSTTPTSNFRAYEDTSSQDNVLICESRIKDRSTSERDQEGAIDVETDEPTYIDMDSSTTVKSVSSRHHNDYGTSSVYTSRQAVISHDLPRSFRQTEAPAGDYENNTGIGSSKPETSPSVVSFSSGSVLPSSSLSLLRSSSSLSSSSSSSSRPFPTNGDHSIHLCDSSHNTSSNAISGEDHLHSFYNNRDTNTAVGCQQQQVTQQVSTTTSALNPTDGVDDLQHRHLHQHHHHPQQQQQQNTKAYHQTQEEESQPLQQNPDSSSSPPAVAFDSPTSSWGDSTTSFGSPASSSSSSIASLQQNSQLSPDSNIPQLSSGSPSNKENVRSSIVSSVGGDVSTGGTSARRSFFQIDKKFIEEYGNGSLLSEQFQGQDSNRSGVLDFWISKILMEESPRQQRCTVDGSRRIRLRLVDLIELQVEQSLKA